MQKKIVASKTNLFEKRRRFWLRIFCKNMGVNIAQTDLDEINLSLAQQQFAKKEYAKAIPNYEKF